jgi:ADP-ribose pyrophosphatase
MNAPQSERGGNEPIEERYRGKFLSIYTAGRWEFAQRVNSTGVTAIVAITPNSEIVLVRQNRPPMQGKVLELPAGLVGDEPGEQDESMEKAAQRELLEETGFRAGKIRQVFTGASSAGLTDESITFFLATELTREGPGGGVAGESIETLVVPLNDVDQFIEESAANGCHIDAKLLTGLYLASRR